MYSMLHVHEQQTIHKTNEIFQTESGTFIKSPRLKPHIQLQQDGMKMEKIPQIPFCLAARLLVARTFLELSR